MQIVSIASDSPFSDGHGYRDLRAKSKVLGCRDGALVWQVENVVAGYR